MGLSIFLFFFLSQLWSCCSVGVAITLFEEGGEAEGVQARHKNVMFLKKQLDHFKSFILYEIFDALKLPSKRGDGGPSHPGLHEKSQLLFDHESLI